MSGSEETVMIMACPTCRRSVPWREESRYRPFCSARCKLIDLGAWADESNRIASVSAYDDLSSED